MRRLILVLATTILASIGTQLHAEPLHGIAMHGAPALPADYQHFSYVNPDVKKGGAISYGVVGDFDSLNPFVLKSMRTTARGMWDPEFGNLVFESLMLRSRDEPFTMYGLLAETVEWDDDRTYIQFNMNPNAKWADGMPVTADDVIFTFELMAEKGRPPYNRRLSRVEKMEKIGENSVRFTFNEKSNREYPLIMALSPVLPKHATDVETFESSTLTPPVGSGPYAIKDVKPGQRIVYERRDDYWAKDLPVKRGFDNYDEISVEYFLSQAAQFEAFKKGEFDIFAEGNPTKWARAYDFPAVNDGSIVKQEFKRQTPSGMFGFVFNTRREVFQNKDLRRGLAMLFDFEWVNRTLFDNAYTRTQSFWQGSILSSLGVPADTFENALLAPFADHMEASVMDGSYRVPVTDGSGNDRTVQRAALAHLTKAGYAIKDGKLVDGNGTPLTFEVMTQNEDQEKIALAYQRNLAALGIDIAIRTVDDAQYQKRSQTYDFDVIMKAFSSSLSPGAEQIWRWESRSRDVEGTFNFAGVQEPAIDAAIEALLQARSLEDFQSAVRAYDRTLISGHYVVPLYHIGQQWVAHRDYIGRPESEPLYGYQLPVWFDKRAQ